MKRYFGLAVIIALAAWLFSRAEIKLPQAPLPPPQLKLTFTGWQDAVSEKYGYRLKMPHDWSVVQIDGEPAYPQRMKLINVKPEDQRKPHVGIVVTVFDLGKNPPEEHGEIKALSDEGREPKRLTAAGEPAMFFDNLGDSGEEFSLFVPHKNYLYRFDWTGTHPDVRKQYKDTGLKVLASLQFE